MFDRSNMTSRLALCIVLALSLASMGIMGCSSSSGPSGDGGQQGSETALIRGDINPDDVAFEYTSDGEDGVGPYMILGRNIEFDSETNTLSVDLSVKNLGSMSYPEPVTLTFLSLLPEGVEVKNPDNDVNGPGAMIEFEFDNDDNQWTPEEESLPRKTLFDTGDATSIAFVSRIDVGDDSGELGTIAGIVWDDDDENGVIDDGEDGIGGVEVVLTCDDMNMEPKKAETDLDGMYKFEDLESGFYTVTKTPEDACSPTTSTVLYVVLAEDEGDVDPFLAANFGCKVEIVVETADIGGIVYNDENKNGTQDDGEMGIPGLEVGLLGAGLDKATETDMMGMYRFEDLEAGTYAITKEPVLGWEPTTENPAEVILGLEDKLDVDFGCAEIEIETGAIGGTVFNDMNENGVQNEGEMGIAGVEVAIVGVGLDKVTETDMMGMYSFEDLTAGTYTITKEPELGWEATTDNPVQVILVETEGSVDPKLDVDFGCVEIMTQ